MRLQAAFVCLPAHCLHFNAQTTHCLWGGFSTVLPQHLPSKWSNVPQTIIMQAVCFFV